MAFITEWIKNGKIKKFKKQLEKTENRIEKQEGVILGKEKELHSLYSDLEKKTNEVESIKKELLSLGYVFDEEPVAEIEVESNTEIKAESTDEIEEENSTALVEKKDLTPIMTNSQSNIKFRVGKSVLYLNKMTKQDFIDMVDKKYNVMVSAYDKVIKALYPQMYMGEAENIQRQNYINEITKMYNAVTSKYGDISIDKAKDFLNASLEVGIGYDLELQKKDDINSKKYLNTTYKSVAAFLKNPVQIPNNAMKINVTIRSDVNKLNKWKKLAGINIYLFESAKYTRDAAKEVFYEVNKYEPKYSDKSYQDIANDDYFYYNQTQCDVISDKVLAKNTVAKAMYKDELRTGFIDFVEPELNNK